MTAFDADPGPVRLISRGEPAAADYVLRLDVRNFEVQYDHGPKAAPTAPAEHSHGVISTIASLLSHLL